MQSSTRSRTASRAVELGRPDPAARLRLFCFPYAGGSAAVYREWGRLLPAEIQVAAVQLPGRGSRFTERLLQRLDGVVEQLAAELAPFMDRPFAFFGHSMGALTAFELTRHLRRAGGPLPERLVVSGRRAPQLPGERVPLHELPEEEFLDELRRLNGTPEEILESRELMELFSPVLRADFAVCETYRYAEEPPLEIPVSALGGLADPDVGREAVEAWREQTRAAFVLRMFPGGHFFLNSNRDAVVRAVSLDLLETAPR